MFPYPFVHMINDKVHILASNQRYCTILFGYDAQECFCGPMHRKGMGIFAEVLVN